MRHERQDHTLQATVLVHEAFLQLAGNSQIDWQNRAHFFALASRAMRRVLIDYARSAHAEKRPCAHQRVDLDSGLIPVGAENTDVLALDEAWTQPVLRGGSLVRVLCHGDTDRDWEVEELLGANESADSFREKPAVDLRGYLAKASRQPSFVAGTIVAKRFEILRFLNRG